MEREITFAIKMVAMLFSIPLVLVGMNYASEKIVEIMNEVNAAEDYSTALIGLWNVFKPILFAFIALLVGILIIVTYAYFWDVIRGFFNNMKKKSKNKSIRLLQNCLINETGFVHYQIKLIVDLYEGDPKKYQPLVYKYAETFRIFHSVVFEAIKSKNKHIFKETAFQQKITDLLAYPIKDFKMIDDLVKQNKKLEKDLEITSLHSQIQDEIIMQESIKKMKKVDS